MIQGKRKPMLLSLLLWKILCQASHGDKNFRCSHWSASLLETTHWFRLKKISKSVGIACVQTSPLPQKKNREKIFFLREGGRLYTGYVEINCESPLLPIIPNFDDLVLLPWISFLNILYCRLVLHRLFQPKLYLPFAKVSSKYSPYI